jgi:UDP-N-acetylglucosamine 2-epimerase (non-hydrolysing)
MSYVFFDDLHLPRPDVNLGVGSGTHAEQTANIMLRFEPVLLEYQPDLVLVVGDVNSTLACTLVAAKLGVQVAHVEAGVRSFDRTMPEEINRVATDALADWLFTPSRAANRNLQKEGISKRKVHFVGNVMVDTLLGAFELATKRQAWQTWGLAPHDYAVVTLHRAGNVDDLGTLGILLDTLSRLATRIPVVFPVHPRTTRRIADAGLNAATRRAPHLFLVEPLGYLDFLGLMGNAKIVLTDSGGVQAETTMLGIPCLTLRWNTEWIETLSEGTNILVGTDPARILAEAESILGDGGKIGRRPARWDGKAARRIVEILTRI